MARSRKVHGDPSADNFDLQWGLTTIFSKPSCDKVIMKKDELVFLPQLHIASEKASVFQESSTASVFQTQDISHIPSHLHTEGKALFLFDIL